MAELNVLSYNARGLRQSKKRRRLFSYFHRRKTDVIIVQETHSSRRDETIWKNEWGGNIYFSHGTTDSCGICILFRPSLNFDILKLELHNLGRFIIADLKVVNHLVTLVGIYGPNSDNTNFFKDVAQKMQSFACENVIMCGDFNFVFN